MRLTRPKPIRICGALAALALLSSCGANGASADDGTFTVGYQDPWTLLPFYVAEANGMLDEHGIDAPEYQQVQDTPALLTATSGGDVDASMQAVQVVAAHNAKTSGPKLRYFAPLLLNSTALSAGQGSGITPADADDWQSAALSLKGKTIGVNARGGFAEGMVSYMAEQVGLEPGKDFSIVQTGFGPAALAALEEGHVDATVQVTLLSTEVEVERLGYPVVELTRGTGPELLQNHFGSGLIASEDRLSAYTETYDAVAAMLAEAREFIADPDNKEAVIDVLEDKYTQESEPFAEALYESRNEFVAATLDAESLQKAIDAQAALGFMQEPLPMPEDLNWRTNED